jgi:hypothetical protein
MEQFLFTFDSKCLNKPLACDEWWEAFGTGWGHVDPNGWLSSKWCDKEHEGKLLERYRHQPVEGLLAAGAKEARRYLAVRRRSGRVR